MFKAALEHADNINAFNSQLTIQRITQGSNKKLMHSVVVTSKELICDSGPDIDIARSQRCLQNCIVRHDIAGINTALNVLIKLNAKARHLIPAMAMLEHIHAFRKTTDDDRELLAILKELYQFPTAMDFSAGFLINVAIDVNDLLLLYTAIDIHKHLKAGSYVHHVYKCIKTEKYLMATVLAFCDL
jgi:hypothetical protein